MLPDANGLTARIVSGVSEPYSAKLRLGSRLIASSIFARHRNPVVNRMIRLAAPFAAFDRWDPDLRRLTAEGKAA